MATLIHFSLRALVLLIVLVVGFAVMKPFLSCNDKSAVQCLNFKLHTMLSPSK